MWILGLVFELARYTIDCGDLTQGFAALAKAREEVETRLGPNHPGSVYVEIYIKKPEEHALRVFVENVALCALNLLNSQLDLLDRHVGTRSVHVWHEPLARQAW